MILQQKEIVLLPYPFSDLTRKKVRPALVVSNNEFNNKSEDFIAVPLTSIIKDELYSIIINQEDLRSGKLLKQSIVRADKLFSVDKSLIIMRIGILKDTTFNKVKSEIIKVF